jgi:hypothetical protein
MAGTPHARIANFPGILFLEGVSGCIVCDSVINHLNFLVSCTTCSVARRLEAGIKIGAAEIQQISDQALTLRLDAESRSKSRL